MKIRFVTDHVSSSGVKRREGDVRDYPDGMADILIRRHKAEPFVETRPSYKPKIKRLDP